MYCWPLTQMFSDLPFGGSFWLGPEAKSVPPSASCSPLAPEFGGLRIAGSLAKVKVARTTRISAAPTVQPISRRVLPRIWAATAPLRARNLISE